MANKSRMIPLTEGSILAGLTKLAMPIIATSFVQMAYSLIDMVWVGRLGSGAVAAVGTSGFFTCLANAFIIIARIGAEGGVAQAMGGQDGEGVAKAIGHSLQVIVALSLIYAAGLFALREPLLGLSRLGEDIQGTTST